jgi:hypothetical protein
MFEVIEETEWGDIVRDEIVFALQKLGSAVVEPALAAFEPNASEDLSGAMAAVLSKAGARNERIFAAFVEHFEGDPEMGAAYLADYGDPRAVPHLSAELDRQNVPSTSDNLFADQTLIELAAAIEGLGGTLTPGQQIKLRAVDARRDLLLGRSRKRPEASQAAVSAPKLGRNAPCWCGSHKKYKKCHLDEDERNAGARVAWPSSAEDSTTISR